MSAKSQSDVEPASESMIRILVNDVQAALERLQSSDTQRDRREAIRTIYAGIEGAHWIAKSALLDCAPSIIKLSLHEIAALKEQSYAVTERGVVKPQPKFIPLRTSIRLACVILQRMKPDYTLELTHPAWANLQRAAETRNRITHPKTSADLQVTTEDVGEAVVAFNWVLAATIETQLVLRDCGEARNERLRKGLAKAQEAASLPPTA